MRNIGRSHIIRSMIGLVVVESGMICATFFPTEATAANICTKPFEPFIRQMLTELPAYANRVNTRAGNRQSYVILASREDFEALPLLQASFPNSDVDADIRQVFFSTLLKRFSQQQMVQHQEHHWLLMTPSDRGWEFVQMYSILDRYPSQNLAAPPRNSSHGSIATAIKDWLKNCHPPTPS